MEPRQEDQVEHYVYDKLDRADEQRNVRLIERSSPASHRRFNSRAESRERADADIRQACCPDAFGDKRRCESVRSRAKNDAQDQAQCRLKHDQGIGEFDARGERSGASIANHDPGCSGEALVENFGHHANVGVGVCGDDE